jgi:hypothetical protein
MDIKEAARAASALVEDYTSVGLGWVDRTVAGSTSDKQNECGLKSVYIPHRQNPDFL